MAKPKLLDKYRQQEAARRQRREALRATVAQSTLEEKFVRVQEDAARMLDLVTRRVAIIDAVLTSLPEEGLGEYLPLAQDEGERLKAMAEALAPRIRAVEALTATEPEVEALAQDIELFWAACRRSFFQQYLEYRISAQAGSLGGSAKALLPGIVAATRDLLVLCPPGPRKRTEGFYWRMTEQWTSQLPHEVDGFQVYRDGDKLVQVATETADKDSPIGEDAFCKNYLRPLKKKPRT